MGGRGEIRSACEGDLKIDTGLLALVFSIIFGSLSYLNSTRQAKRDETQELRERVSYLEQEVKQLREERDDYARKLARLG